MTSGSFNDMLTADYVSLMMRNSRPNVNATFNELHLRSVDFLLFCSAATEESGGSDIISDARLHLSTQSNGERCSSMNLITSNKTLMGTFFSFTPRLLRAKLYLQELKKVAAFFCPK